MRYDMTINDVLFFDAETTGIPDRAAKWDTDFADFPHVVQLAWMYDYGGRRICKSHIIRPDGWEIPEDTVAVHGITTEYALEHGEPFAAVVDMFLRDCHEAGLICGHNIYFDVSIVKANILRELGRIYYDANDVESALYKGKRIDTMRPTMKWVDARMANGRLKFPNLTELYSRCFPGESFPAHDALEDVKAVARCLPVILDLGLVELKVKEYPAEPADNAGESAKTDAESDKAPENAKNGPISGLKEKDDKLPIQSAEAPQIAKSEKIADAAAELLEQNDF